jgi:uncharacterized protein
VSFNGVVPAESCLSKIPPLQNPVFIADLHLAADKPATKEAFFKFLKNDAARFSELVILGDLFKNDADALAPLLAKGLDPNTVTSSGAGEPLLMLAIRKNANSVIDLLLKQKNIKVDQPNTLKETPLMIAIFLKDNDVAKKLIARGAAVNNPKNWSPLHYAATSGNKEMVKYLISKGADVNARTLRGITPLYMAAREADADTVKLLLHAGARKDYCTNVFMCIGEI